MIAMIDPHLLLLLLMLILLLLSMPDPPRVCWVAAVHCVHQGAARLAAVAEGRHGRHQGGAARPAPERGAAEGPRLPGPPVPQVGGHLSRTVRV